MSVKSGSLMVKYGITTLVIVLALFLLNMIPLFIYLNPFLGAFFASLFFFYFFYQYIKHDNYLAIIGILVAMGGCTNFGGNILAAYNGIWLIGINFLICLAWYLFNFRKTHGA